MTYREQIRSPQWIKFATDFKEENGWKCQACGVSQSPNSELSVHHIYYVSGMRMWDHPKSVLECLCARCHKKRQSLQQEEILEFAKTLKGKFYRPDFTPSPIFKPQQSFPAVSATSLWNEAVELFRKTNPDHIHLVLEPCMSLLGIERNEGLPPRALLIMNPEFPDGIPILFTADVAASLRAALSAVTGQFTKFAVAGISNDMLAQLGLQYPHARFVENSTPSH